MRAMHKVTVFYFGGLLVLAIAAFWRTYFFPPKAEGDWHVHLHGMAMFAWVVLMVAQAGLVRARRLAVHRALGKVSYGLVPLLVVSTVLLAHYRLRTQGLNDELLYFLAVQLGLIAVLALAYGLAMAHRREPAVHARYMVCVALTLVDPIVARLLYFTTGSVPPLMQVATYAMVDAILLALVAADRRAQRPARVYPAMLAVFVAAQWPTFVLPGTAAWRAFAAAFAALPLP